MARYNWRLLQLFSQEETLPAVTGEESAAAAGQHEGGEDTGNRANTQAAAAPQDIPAKRMTWEEIKKDPEYNREIQAIIRSRLKSAGKEPEPGGSDEALSAQFRQHIRDLEQQGEAMKAQFPGFDLRRELENPAFARMTAPDVGIRVEDAYYALHRGQIQSAAMQVTAQKTAQMISDAIRSGSMRPAENGTVAQSATVAYFDYRNASPQQRSDLKRRIRQAGARGEKLYPGQ